ncbi:acyl-CoA thioesterase domain-containing protein [Streptomyces sp. CC224B]|uniref:acyl-CoA thioesterase n=1 Tax=Streptomyces sp. CC224B TaxID=3044571 RepID=UPI0024A8D4B3|nr:acyl-CoA thioesterase domain-containing protein [Streptomyces sp. CC224B]
MTTDHSTAVEDLLDVLTPDRIDARTFRPRGPVSWSSRHLYGGQVAAQALLAAGRTVAEDRPVHSLHAYFVRPGDPDAAVPLLFDVDEVRDGRAVSLRQVTARQRDAVLFTLSASFHRAEPGLDHQDLMPAVGVPEALPTYEERLARALGEPVLPLGMPFDLRYAGPLSVEAQRDPALRTGSNPLWLRTNGALPGDLPPLVHAALLTYISDILLDTVALRHGLSWADGTARPRSVDHAQWFHRPFRADDWLLLAQDTPVAYGGRALARAQVFTRGGDLVASAVQEGLVRLRRRPAAEPEGPVSGPGPRTPRSPGR